MGKGGPLMPFTLEPTSPAPAPLVVANEFARVSVSLDRTANGPRLLVTDLETGREIRLDPLELEGLTRLTHEAIARMVAPS
jgi:hypothetical protein